ncbi:MAG: ATP-binding protein, partial [Deltaproteobacteria bacterium]|nr:ATP-binding protein [Deltaproteobacteria bacterium]
MLTNLIRNAIQHTPSGKISVIVKDDRVIVSDSGTGMEPDVLKLVTQSPSDEDRYRGHGIGLTIVRRLCNRLGWKLKFASEPGRGTTAQLIFS